MPKPLYIGILLAAVCICSGVRSAHLKGGYIEYRYMGPTPGSANSSRYQVLVYQYLDCASTGAQIDIDIYLGVYTTNTSQLVLSKTLQLESAVPLEKTSFVCINNPPNICFSTYRYVTEVDLLHRQGGYLFTVQRCCRIADIINISLSQSTGVSYSLVVPTLAADGSVLVNSSPVFSQKDTALVCAGNSFVLPFEATDPDGDSLSFAFTAGLNTPSAEAKPSPPLPPPFPDVSYVDPYYSDKPLGEEVFIDAGTGVISGIAPETPGQYVVAVLVTEYRNGIPVAEARKEIHITVGNCDIPQAILPKRIIECDRFTIQLENRSTSSGINSYLWDFGVKGTNNDTSTSPLPSFTYADTGVYSISLIVNREGQCPDTATAELRLYPGFETRIDVNGVCLQLPYTFTDRTFVQYGFVNSHQWEFTGPRGTTERSTLPSFTRQYTNIGTYPIRLISSSNLGCIDTATLNLEVLAAPRLQLAFRDTLICNLDSIQLVAKGTGNFLWSGPGLVSNPNSAVVWAYPGRSSTYNVSLDDRGCKGKDSIRINVISNLQVDLGKDTLICRNDAIQLNPITQGLQFSWSPSSLFQVQGLRQPAIAPADSITVVTVTAAVGKCIASDTKTIITAPYPIVDAGTDTTICFGETAVLAGTTNASNIQWTPSGFIDQATNVKTNAFPKNTTRFTLTGRNTSGCTKPVSDHVTVNVLPQVILNAGNDTLAVLGQPLQLNATTNYGSISWSPPLGLSNTSVGNPVLFFPIGNLPDGMEVIPYTAKATTAAGCIVTDTVAIKLFTTGPRIFVPSGFTPNGDGLNDIIKPILPGVRALEFFRVYNRYGQLVFETREINRGWDGRINGQLQTSGTFVYHVQAEDYQGTKLFDKGTFVLVR